MRGNNLLFLFMFLVFDFVLGRLGGSELSKSLLKNIILDSPLPYDEWIMQKLDHFDATNSNTWRQRYQSNKSWFKKPREGPIFLMIGGEGEANPIGLLGGAWVDYAKEFNALCFQLEHRFYGKSQPFEKFDELTVENLRYLSSEQALADIANFIQGMNEKYDLSPNNKWIVFGGSYAGSLAAWARLKYPHLIHAAVSSSGPVLAEANFKAYDEVMRSSLSRDSENCADTVHLAALTVEKHLRTQEGANLLTKKFNLCEPLNITNQKDVSLFVEQLSGVIENVVQYNADNGVADMCKIMTEDHIDILDRYVAVRKWFFRFQPYCTEVSYYKYIEGLRSTLVSGMDRQWTYQTCTEFGFYQTSSSERELFGSLLNLQFYVDQCKDIFGEDFDSNLLNEGIKWTNINYGQLDIEVSRVVFVQGSRDPWHVLGINKSKPGAPAIVIDGTAHCGDMQPPSPEDPPQLVAAREKIVRLIGEWLAIN